MGDFGIKLLICSRNSRAASAMRRNSSLHQIEEMANLPGVIQETEQPDSSTSVQTDSASRTDSSPPVPTDSASLPGSAQVTGDTESATVENEDKSHSASSEKPENAAHSQA